MKIFLFYVSLFIDVCSFNVLLVLKLNNAIDWSWWWIIAPLLIPLCIAVLGIIAILSYLGFLLLREVNRDF